MEERLQKILARAGFASRRGAEQLMAEGRVTVNGEIASELGTKADLERDDVRVDGVRVKAPRGPVYLLLNKPRGVVTTRRDPEGRPTVMDLVPQVPGLFPVGRLDVTTEGLLILTNDGVFAERVSHPRFEVPRVYHAKVHGVPDGHTLERLRRGVTVEGDVLTVDHVRVLESDNNAWVEVTLHEGRKHEVKRLLEAVGHPVSKLRRVAFGPVTTKGLEPGQFRELLPEEVLGLVRGEGRPRTPLRGGRKPKRHAHGPGPRARGRDDAGGQRRGTGAERRERPPQHAEDRRGIRPARPYQGEDRRDSRSSRPPFDGERGAGRRGATGARRGASRPPFRSSDGGYRDRESGFRGGEGGFRRESASGRGFGRGGRGQGAGSRGDTRGQGSGFRGGGSGSGSRGGRSAGSGSAFGGQRGETGGFRGGGRKGAQGGTGSGTGRGGSTGRGRRGGGSRR